MYILILVGAISMAIWSALNASYIRKGVDHETGWSSTFVLGGSFLSVSLYLLLFWIILWMLGIVSFPLNSVFWVSLSITVVLNILFEFFRFRAYSVAHLGSVSPFSAISPALSIISSWFILREVPTIGAVCGILLIMISIYVLHIRKGEGFFGPFRSVWTNQGSRLAFLAAIPPALSIVFDKKAIIASDPISFSLCAVFFIGCGAYLIDIYSQGKEKFMEQIKLVKTKKFLQIGFFHFVTIASFNSALLFDVTPNISALRRIVIIFEVLFGYIILKQKEDMRRRVMVSIGVVIGVMFIILFRK
jgi:drug/metabolite transporter (DMT)-like permease